VKQGSLSIYTEAAAKDHKLTGYAKPIIKDLRVVNWKEDKSHPLKLAWESLIGAVNWVVKNKGKDQLATRIEFSGDLRDPNISTWYIIGQVLRNGFIQALYPALENSVNINSVNEVKITNGKLEKKRAREGATDTRRASPAVGQDRDKKEVRKEEKKKAKEEKKKKKDAKA
jgi:hypothetical protein